MFMNTENLFDPEDDPLKDDDDYTAKVKKGVLADSDEYHLIDNRLYFTEIDLKTPFVLKLSGNHQVIEIYDGENSTGITITIVSN